MRVLTATAVAVLAGEAGAQVTVLPLPVHPVHGQLIPRRISGDGDVVVGYGRTPRSAAMVWTISTNTLEVLPQGTPAGTNHTGSGCSSDGDVIVGTCAGPAGQTGYLWRRSTGQVVLLNGLSGQQRMFSAVAVSGDGRVVGGDTPSGTNRAAVWTAEAGTRVIMPAAGGAATRSIGDLSNDGASGVGTTSGAGDPFVWREGEGSFRVPMPAGVLHTARVTMTGLGDAVFCVGGGDTAWTGKAYTWNPDSGTTVIADLPETQLALTAATDDGRLVVGSRTPVGQGALETAVVHTFGVGTVTLAEYASLFGGAYNDLDFTEALGISAAGNVILGEGGLHPYWVMILPPLGRSDFNADRFTDFHDLTDFLDCFDGRGPLPVSSADLNRDGITDFFDLIEFLDHF